MPPSLAIRNGEGRLRARLSGGEAQTAAPEHPTEMSAMGLRIASELAGTMVAPHEHYCSDCPRPNWSGLQITATALQITA